jgi:hypothetical protein
MNIKRKSLWIWERDLNSSELLQLEGTYKHGNEPSVVIAEK